MAVDLVLWAEDVEPVLAGLKVVYSSPLWELRHNGLISTIL